MPVDQNHTTTLTKTKEEILGFLDKLIEFARTIHQLLYNSDNSDAAIHSLKSIKRLEHDRLNVANLELRMSVVAPMKAGKSTIINAVLGQNILPSRNSAMTVLPTEVVLHLTSTNNEIQKPYLSLHQTLISQLVHLQHDIQKQLKSSGAAISQLPQRLPNHPHLVDFAENILNDIIKFEENNEGVESINDVLQSVNDVIRLHEYLNPTKALGSTEQLCFELPRIHVPYISILSDSLTNQSLGNLVLVDTPGPNENTATPFLKQIVQHELDKSFVILVVLDFNQFNTEADKAITLEISKIREANHKRADTLYALVNKVDQRRQRDMKKDQVHQLVKGMFQMDENTNANDRIFEVQAFRALMSKQFFIELNAIPEQANDIQFNISMLPSSKDFLVEAYGAAYDEESDTPTKEQAIKDAQKLWRKSGFEAFLTGVIERLIEKAAPRLLKEALARCETKLYRFDENLLIREKLLDADEKNLRRQMELLKQDEETLTDVMHAQMDKLQIMKEEMKSLFIKYFQEVAQESQKKIQEVFDGTYSDVQTEQERKLEESIIIPHNVSSLVITLTKLFYENTRETIAGAIAQLKNAFKQYPDALESLERIKFDSEEDAKQFVRKIEVKVRDIPETALVSLRKYVDQQCVSFCSEMNDHLQMVTNVIMNLMKERLTHELNIDFPKPPVFNLKFSNDDTKSTDVKIEKAHAPWWLLGLVSISYEDGVKEDTSYYVSIPSLKIHCERLLTNCMESIEKHLQNYMNGELQQTFDSHFKDLQMHLKHYQNYISQSLEDQKRTSDDKAQFKNQIIAQHDVVHDYQKTLTTISENFYKQMEK